MSEHGKSLHDALNDVCRLLPDGWEVVIRLEHNGGGFELFDEEGEEVDYPSNRESYQESLDDAVQYAIENAFSEDEDEDTPCP